MIIGHDKLKKSLCDYFFNSNFNSNSFIFSGPMGVGKCLTAQHFAANLINGVVDFEKKSENFNDILNNSCYGYYYLKCDDDNKIGIDEVRDFIASSFLSSSSKRKIFLIDSLDNMNINCQNALLKTLEDLSQGNVFILICHDKTKVLKTIISRSIQINFSKLKDNEIDEYFKNKIDIHDLEYKVVKKIADGSIGLIEKIFDKNLLKVFYDFNNVLINPNEYMLENFEYLTKDSTYIKYCIKYFILEIYCYINDENNYIFDNSNELHQKFKTIYNNKIDAISHIEYINKVYQANKTLTFNNKMIFLDIFKPFLK